MALVAGCGGGSDTSDAEPSVPASPAEAGFDPRLADEWQGGVPRAYGDGLNAFAWQDGQATLLIGVADNDVPQRQYAERVREGTIKEATRVGDVGYLRTSKPSPLKPIELDGEPGYQFTLEFASKPVKQGFNLDVDVLTASHDDLAYSAVLYAPQGSGLDVEGALADFRWTEPSA